MHAHVRFVEDLDEQGDGTDEWQWRTSCAGEDRAYRWVSDEDQGVSIEKKKKKEDIVNCTN